MKLQIGKALAAAALFSMTSTAALAGGGGQAKSEILYRCSGAPFTVLVLLTENNNLLLDAGNAEGVYFRQSQARGATTLEFRGTVADGKETPFHGALTTDDFDGQGSTATLEISTVPGTLTCAHED